MRRVALMVALCGCGRIDFDPASDAACTFGPFAAPQRVGGPVQTTGDDWYPTPTADELGLYYYNTINADFRLVMATRASTAEDFSARLDVVPELDSTMDEKAPTITADGRVIVFVRHLPGVSDLYEATRSSTAVPFGAAVRIDPLTTPDTELDPWLSPDGLRLTYSNANHIAESTRTDRSSPWGPPVIYPELDAGLYQVSPTLSADGLELFYAAGSDGAIDVYRSTRASLTASFDPPQRVPSLSSARDDVGLRLSVDGATLYLNYDTLFGGGGNADVWVATRSCL